MPDLAVIAVPLRRLFQRRRHRGSARHRCRDHPDGGLGSRHARFARGALREKCPCRGTAPRRTQLPRRVGAARQTQCELCRLDAAAGRSGARSRSPAPSRRDWSNGPPFAASDFPPSSPLATVSTSILPICSITSPWIGRRGRFCFHRIDQGRAQIHVGGARCRPRKTGAGHQIGRHAQGAKAAMTHTGALAGSDAVYDAAFRRAGLLRVLDLDELFAAAETLGHLTTLSGKRLAILTNGGGVGVLAVDRLADFAGELADISADTMKKLDAAIAGDLVARQSRRHCRRRRRGEVRGGARAIARRRRQRRRPGDERADGAWRRPPMRRMAVIAVTQQHRQRSALAKPGFAVWIGGSDPAADAFDAAGIPSYATESDAVAGFMHLALPRIARPLDGDAAELAAGHRARQRRGAADHRGGAARQARPGSIRSR